jgi:hypothetical protein
LKLLYWDGSGLVLVYKRLEDSGFAGPAVRDGVIALNHAQLEAHFAELDWRKVRVLEASAPAAGEWIKSLDLRVVAIVQWYLQHMQPSPAVDLLAIPPAQRAAVVALMKEVTALKGITGGKNN